ncbi:FadR/GntR family transcriptional regulator (plasmid) [Nocardioides sp. R1-1]|uniref:FadR/GntR family transcriptional regulator n=1 Tax=Nocardioides sp. R1-1 TaxID=3383502 RepID=UPI0038D2302C
MTTNRMDSADGVAQRRRGFLDSAPAQLSRPVKTSERIAAALVDDVIREDLGPGDRLPNEAAMVERFGVGRGSLREALRILETHGLISLKSGPGGGPILLAVDPRDVGRTFSLYLSLRHATIAELIETRIFIEPMVARLAASNTDSEARERLANALAAEAEATALDSRFVDAANDFHYVVGSMTGNSVIDLVATALKQLYTTKVVSAGIISQRVAPSIREEHREIGQAIIKGDPDLAEDLMRKHMHYYLGRMSEVEPQFTASTISWG